MNYEVVYDLLGQSYNFKAVGLGLLITSLGVFFHWSKTKNRSWLVGRILRFLGLANFSTLSNILLVCMGLYVTAESVYHLIGVQYKLKKLYMEGNYKIVEGAIENFKPMPYHGHAKESFEVDGIKFAYTDYLVSAGFSHPAAFGGPIRQGLIVKISYIGGYILKLEIAKDEKGQNCFEFN